MAPLFALGRHDDSLAQIASREELRNEVAAFKEWQSSQLISDMG